jgi:hypothetical protein
VPARRITRSGGAAVDLSIEADRRFSTEHRERLDEDREKQRRGVREAVIRSDGAIQCTIGLPVGYKAM